MWATINDCKITEQVKEFNYLGCSVSDVDNIYIRLYGKLRGFQWKYSAITKNKPYVKKI